MTLERINARVFRFPIGLIDDACDELVDAAKAHDCEAWMLFNGTLVIAKPDSDPVDLAASYWKDREKK